LKKYHEWQLKKDKWLRGVKVSPLESVESINERLSLGFDELVPAPDQAEEAWKEYLLTQDQAYTLSNEYTFKAGYDAAKKELSK
jgi:hypothetical protein